MQRRLIHLVTFVSVCQLKKGGEMLQTSSTACAKAPCWNKRRTFKSTKLMSEEVSLERQKSALTYSRRHLLEVVPIRKNEEMSSFVWGTVRLVCSLWSLKSQFVFQFIDTQSK